MSKVATKPKTFGLRELYANYAEVIIRNNPDYTFKRDSGLQKGIIYREDKTIFTTYRIFKNILKLYYIKAGVNLINGQAFNLGNGLGDLLIVRQGRNPMMKPRLNRGESFKLKKKLEAEGKDTSTGNWKVYYTDEEFTRTAWHKPAGTKNIKFYKFSPANGQAGKGFKQIMSRTITSNPNLLAIYPFIPYKAKKYETVSN